MSKAGGEWWRGFVVGGAVSWIIAATLLALYARATALIPHDEPLHSQFVADANRIALQIFGIAAAPGILALLIFTLVERLRKR